MPTGSDGGGERPRPRRVSGAARCRVRRGRPLVDVDGGTVHQPWRWCGARRRARVTSRRRSGPAADACRPATGRDRRPCAARTRTPRDAAGSGSARRPGPATTAVSHVGRFDHALGGHGVGRAAAESGQQQIGADTLRAQTAHLDAAVAVGDRRATRRARQRRAWSRCTARPRCSRADRRPRRSTGDSPRPSRASTAAPPGRRRRGPSR